MAASYTFRLTAEGLDKVRTELLALGEAGAKAFERMREASPSLQTSLERMEQATQRTTDALKSKAAATDKAVDSQRRLQTAVQQSGYQIGDFFTQVASGQSALVAFAQQGGQLLQFFGTGGIIASVALTMGAVAAQMLGARTAADGLSDAISRQEQAYRSAKESADRFVDGIGDEVKELSRLQTYYQSLTQSVRQFEAARLAAASNDILRQQFEQSSSVLSPGFGILQNQQGEAPAFDVLGNSTGFTTGSPSTNPRAVAFSDALQAFREAGTPSTASLADLHGRMVALSAGSDLIADRARDTIARIEKAREAVQRLERAADQLSGQRDALNGNILPLPPPAVDNLGGGSASGGSAAARAAELARRFRESLEAGPGTVFPATAVQQALQKQADAEKKMEQDAEARLQREEDRRQESLNRTAERYSQQLSTGITDALFNGFKNGEGALQTLGNALERALKTAIAASLDADIFRPLIRDLLGGIGLGGSGTASGVGGGSSTGGLSSVLGLGGIGGQLRSVLGLGGSGGNLFGSLGSSVTVKT